MEVIMRQRYILSFLLFFTGFSMRAVEVNRADYAMQQIKNECAQWERIDLNALSFPINFQFGTAESDFQTAGPYYLDENGFKQEAISNWTDWVRKKNIKLGDVLKRWEPQIWQKDYNLIAQSGLDAHRIEASWSKIEPKKGQFNSSYMKSLKERVFYLQAQGLEVWMSLSHFVWPEWFDKKGAFEKAENIQDFVDFAQYVYKEIPSIKFWITFNEPLVIPMDAYWGLWYNKLAPGKRQITTKLAATVFKNILDAHIEVYHALKAIDSSRNIGVIDVVAPSSSEKQNIALYGLMSALGWNTLNDIELNYFKTGTFYWPTAIGSVSGFNSKAIGALDFFGINYYSLTPVGLTTPSGDILDEKGQLIYPFGLFEAIKKCSELKVPLYISENGVADAKGVLRDRYIRQHLFMVSKAIELGYDVRGYFYWTFMDTFGWNNYNRKYGLYAVNFDTQERTLRESARNYINFLQARAALKK